ncbi:hypothetical protein OF122_01950 [Pelagibacterium flavum]|uniref:Polysaccharide chain length determinant N-terminal domain-containing protein n=1 Tax=Pelagibacterium flavum TaxID=2984530 RepID=A0ABY6IPQ3_9HYPH|nr:hypothetical protein [Pelagibacterium sp. YIM 151497]UYQ72576.1 hypothetical protein OF122_01950 [Pelagibacterium sp. YIM 151497]
MQDDEISLLDLGVTIAENWLLLVLVPLALGVAAFTFLSLGGHHYRASITVPFAADEIAALWEGSEDNQLAVPNVGLADGVSDGVVIVARGDGQASTLSLVGDAPEELRTALDEIGDIITEAANAGVIAPSQARTAERIDEVRASIALRSQVIADLEADLGGNDEVEGSDYALGALALAQMLEGRAADRARLQALNDEMAATEMPIDGAEVSVESLGRSPLLMAILVVLGSGFFLLILVFVRQGLKGASQDPAAREKIERIRNSLLLRRNS